MTDKLELWARLNGINCKNCRFYLYDDYPNHNDAWCKKPPYTHPNWRHPGWIAHYDIVICKKHER